jgi:hypothetical protein
MVPFWSVGRRTSRGFGRVTSAWGRGGLCATDSVERIIYHLVITYIFACFKMESTTRLGHLLCLSWLMNSAGDVDSLSFSSYSVYA